MSQAKSSRTPRSSRTSKSRRQTRARTKSQRDNSIEEYANRILGGDAREALQSLPAELVQSVVTSPPYFGHRRYAEQLPPQVVAAEIGREKTLESYVENLVELFRQVHRVLREDGTVWLNLGDTYRDGELLGVPWRVALALQQDGWRLRSDIIWHKPNAMPSPVTTRPTVDHEYLFLLSKNAKYYYDADAIREPHVTFSEQSKMRGGRNHFGKRNGTPEQGKNSGNSNLHDGRWDQAFHPKGRNRRTVWSVPLGKCREAHFAVFPEGLIENCIRAGTPPAAIVLDPFFGAGTTGISCLRLGRRYLGCELVPDYIELAQSRIRAVELELGESTAAT